LPDLLRSDSKPRQFSASVVPEAAGFATGARSIVGKPASCALWAESKAASALRQQKRLR